MSSDEQLKRLELFQKLSQLPPQELSKLVFALKPPVEVLYGDQAPMGDKVKALLSWAEGSTGRGLEEVVTLLERIDTLPSPQGSSIQSVALEPDQTRPVLDSWVGREAELQTLTTWQQDGTVRLVEITGAGGYGKSSLAARWMESPPMQEALPRQIWVNFSVAYGFRVFALWLLRELGQSVDESIDQVSLMALLVRQLSAQGMLVVLDNLETLTQDGAVFDDYRQFLGRWLETGQQSLIVLTSREQPELPPNLRRQRCQTLPLKGLTPNAAVALLRDQGVQGSEAEMQEFALLTTGHPLLLNLIMGQLWDEYGDAPPLNRWPELNPDLFAYMGAHRGDPEASVGRVFAASYQRLTPVLQRLLCYLSVYRPRFDRAMAAAMAADTVTDQRQFEKDALRYLVRLALLQEQPPTANSPRRYFLLPLIARYVQQQGDLTPAHERAINFYQAIRKPTLGREDGQAEVAAYLELAHHLCELGQFAAAIDLLQRNTDDENRYSSCQMVIKFRGRQATLLPLYQRIADQWQPQNPYEQNRYGDTLRAQGDVLQFLKQSREALGNYEQALTIYREVGDRLGEANTLKAQGDVLQFLKQSREALGNYEQALTIYREVGDRLGEANTLKAQGDVLQFLKQSREALGNYEQALTIYREVGDRLGEANTLIAQGDVLQFLDQRREALGNYEQALTIYREVGARLGEANTLIAQGDVLQFLDQRREALGNYEQALTIYREVGDRLGEANTLIAQGDVLQFLKQSREALGNYEQALTIYREVGDRLGEANTLKAQGDVLQFLKQSREALGNYEQALTIYREVGARLGEANTLKAQGDVLQFLKQSREALGNYEQALTIYREVGDRLGEANTLKAQGDVLQFLKQSREALGNYEQALTIYREVGDRLGEANTLKAQGDVLQFLDQRREALGNYEQALTIYREVGARLGEANTLKAQGDVLQFLKQSREALGNYEQALTIYREVGARLGEANTLKAQGDVLQFLKQSREALGNYEQALTIYREVGDRLGEANTLKAQGDVLQFLDQRREALGNYEQALTIYREVGDRLGEANTLKAQGDVLQFLKQSREALGNYEQALTIYREVGARLGEANTLQGIGVLQESAEESLAAFLAAQEIYLDIGDSYSQGRNLVLFLGPVYGLLGRVDEARTAFQQAAEIGAAIGFEPLNQYALEQVAKLDEENQPR
jgi:tetratricopeptide (TPR) repeat protein